jgi:hypothetical protein
MKVMKIRPAGKDAYEGKNTLGERKTGEGTGNELIKRGKELMNPNLGRQVEKSDFLNR